MEKSWHAVVTVKEKFFHLDRRGESAKVREGLLYEMERVLYNR